MKHKKNKKDFKNQNGQTLIIFIFLSLLALTFGVSLSNRFIKSLSSATQSLISVRALAIAEAGMEQILTKTTPELASYIDNNNCGSDCIVQVVNEDGLVETATISLSYLGNSEDPYVISLTQTDVYELNLNGYSDNTDVTLCWNTTGSSPPPAVVGMVVRGTAGNYEASSFAVNSAGSVEQNGFDTAIGGSGYDSCTTVSSLTDPKLIRMRSMYDDIDVQITPEPGFSLPSQGIYIRSVGQVSDTTQVVSAIKSEDYLPSMFDFAIYNSSSTEVFTN